MKLFARLSLLSAMVASVTAFSSASILSLASYGSTAVAPTGVSNTALLYHESQPTYDIGTGGVWTAPIGRSSWVSLNPNTYPGGSVIEPNGTYTYTSTFFDASGSTSAGSITVMADDTVSVYLNGILIAAAAAGDPAAHCTVMAPNCTTPTTYALSGFVTGQNTLSFHVDQMFGSATGVDFAGSVNTAATPEPESLVLLGTGLLSGCGMLARRFRA